MVSNLANFYLPTVFRVKSNINGEKGYTAVNQSSNSEWKMNLASLEQPIEKTKIKLLIYRCNGK